MSSKKNVNTITSGRHIFEVVDHVPYGYFIWNIGENMVDGYLPLCRLCNVQPFPGGRNIEVDTLKAIKIAGAQVILAASGYGDDTVHGMEEYIKKHAKSKPGTCAHEEVKRMKKALPLMKQIKGL